MHAANGMALLVGFGMVPVTARPAWPALPCKDGD